MPQNGKGYYVVMTKTIQNLAILAAILRRPLVTPGYITYIIIKSYDPLTII